MSNPIEVTTGGVRVTIDVQPIDGPAESAGWETASGVMVADWLSNVDPTIVEGAVAAKMATSGMGTSPVALAMQVLYEMAHDESVQNAEDRS